MPKIPLADIPNAPRVAGGSNPQTIGSVDLSRTASLLSIPQGAFDGAARGMQSIAQGIGSVGGALAQIGEHVQQQADKHALNQANDVLAKAKADADAEFAANPTDPLAYSEIMQKHLDSAKSQIAGFSEDKDSLGFRRISGNGRQAIQDHIDAFSTRAIGDANVAGIKTLFAQNKDAAVNNIKDLVSQGRTDLAIQQIESNRGKLFFDAEADGLAQHARQQGDILAVTKSMQEDPEKTKEMLADEKNWPSIPAIQRPRFVNEADTEQRRQDADNMNVLADGIGNGSISSPDQAKDIFGDRFSTKYAGKIKAMFAANPDWDKAKESYAAINQEIADLDPSDPEANKKKFNLLIRIRSELPEGFRQDTLQSLDNKVNARPDSSLRTQLSKTLSTARDAGVFGQWDEKKIRTGMKNGKPDTEELAKKNSALSVVYAIQQDGTQWIKQHPGATDEEFSTWLNQRMSQSMKQSEPGWWSRHMPAWMGGGAVTPPDASSAITTLRSKNK